MSQRSAGRAIDPLAWLALPAALYFVVALAIPLALLLFASLRGPDGFGVGNYTRFLGDWHNLGVVWLSIRYAAVVSALCLALGFAYAYVMTRVGPALEKALLVAIVLPMTVSVIVKAFGWTILLRSNGLVNQTFLAFGLIEQPLRLLFTEAGLIVGTVSILLPYAVLPLFSVLRQIPPETQEAAATLGAGPVHRFLRVTLPLSVPGLIAAFGFVFSMTISAYVIPSLLTGAGYKTLSKVVAGAFIVTLDPPLGATGSTILLILAGGAVVLAGALQASWRR